MSDQGGIYRILEVPAAGAFATVVIAERVERPGHPVALKVLKEEAASDGTAWDRFRDEARILAALDHPNIVRAHRLLTYDDLLVLELEAVAGSNLERLIAQDRVPWRVGLAIAERIADALHFAYHAPQGPHGAPMHIVHRDLKPANVMLTPEGQVKILDFGVAKGEFEDRSAQSLHNVWGTLGYDAPERRDGVVVPAADVYALAVLLFVMLTGRPMVVSRKVAHHDVEVAHALAHLEPQGLRDVEPLRSLLTDMLRHDHEARPTMDAVRQRVHALITELEGDSPTLADYALDANARVARYARQVPLRENPWFSDVQFLERIPPDGTPAPMARSLGEGALRELLAQPDWETRMGEVKRLLARIDGRHDGPFLEVLDRASSPWWRFWEQPARPTEVEAALLVLCDDPDDAARTRARALASHEDARVRKAARYLLER